MKKNILKLEKLVVKSFMTEINTATKKTFKGGDDNLDNPENTVQTNNYTTCQNNTCLCMNVSGGEQDSACCGTPYTMVVGRRGGGSGQ